MGLAQSPTERARNAPSLAPLGKMSRPVVHPRTTKKPSHGLASVQREPGSLCRSLRHLPRQRWERRHHDRAAGFTPKPPIFAQMQRKILSTAIFLDPKPQKKIIENGVRLTVMPASRL